MAAVVPLQNKRFEEFHRKCVDGCDSLARFRKEFEVDVGHFVNTTKKDARRYWFDDNMKRAAIIQQGKLKVEQCNDKGNGKVRIVVEGMIKDFRFVDPTAAPVAETRLANVPVRIVVDERKTKVIVTAYVLDGVTNLTQEEFPEIDYEIW